MWNSCRTRMSDTGQRSTSTGCLLRRRWLVLRKSELCWRTCLWRGAKNCAKDSRVSGFLLEQTRQNCAKDRRVSGFLLEHSRPTLHQYVKFVRLVCAGNRKCHNLPFLTPKMKTKTKLCRSLVFHLPVLLHRHHRHLVLRLLFILFSSYWLIGQWRIVMIVGLMYPIISGIGSLELS